MMRIHHVILLSPRTGLVSTVPTSSRIFTGDTISGLYHSTAQRRAHQDLPLEALLSRLSRGNNTWYIDNCIGSEFPGLGRAL